ncbi:MAG: hypothetical protein MUC88_00115 [Planctomycetes bacterium]|jgi:hypothetical protein|nr:hypothetical protein [Planctomycetota bacterium]
MPLLTPQQLEELRQIVRDASTAVSVATTGLRVGPDELKRLVDLGYLREEDIRDLTLDAFEYGRLLEKLPGLAQMSYEDFKRYLEKNPVEMSEQERRAWELARDRAGQFCVGLGTRWSGEVGPAVVPIDEKLAQQFREGIRDETAANVVRREAVGTLTTKLRQMSRDWARDWGRIASTESQMAYQQGFLESTMRRYGSEELLAKMPEPTACPDCKRLYLDEDGKPEAHPASWWAEQGVNNVGRKRDDWLPVMGAVHPWCQCVLTRVPRGMAFNDDWDLVPESMLTEESEKSEAPVAADDLVARLLRVVDQLRVMATKEEDPERRRDMWERRKLALKLIQHYQPLSKARKLHYRTMFAGLPISVENRKGSIRRWHDQATGTDGETRMRVPYGYIRMTEGTDGDHLDVFLGPDENAKQVYVVHQMRAPEFTEVDEDKIMLGWPDLASAKHAYLSHYDNPGFWGSATTIPVEKFRANCLAGKYRKGELVKARQLYLGPRGGRWADPQHTRSYQPEEPKGGPRLHERFGPSGAPQEGERGYKEPIKRPEGAWDGEDPDVLAHDMIAAARKVWEDVDYGMIAKLGDQEPEGGEEPEWQGFTYSDLPDLLHVPYKDGQGEPYTDDQRLMIAERLVHIAGETYAHAAQGETGIELPKVKHRRGWMDDWNPERFREGMAIPTWVAAAILADSMDREHRELRLVNVPKTEAAKFIAEHHKTLPYLNPRGLMYAIGVKRGNRLVAVATAGHPTGRALRGLDPRNVVELTRVASDGTTKNAASMLIARLLDLLETSKRGDLSKPGLFITYQLATEQGNTYRALADKGLRPVEYIRGDRPHGARAGAGEESLTRVDKIRWEAGPAAASADWSLLEHHEQLDLFGKADALAVDISHRSSVGTMGNYGDPARTPGQVAFAPRMAGDHPASEERRRKKKRRGFTDGPKEKQDRMRALAPPNQNWAHPMPEMEGRDERGTEANREVFDQEAERRGRRLQAGRLTLGPGQLRQ